MFVLFLCLICVDALLAANSFDIAEPLPIKAQIFIVDIDNISTPKQSFTANVFGAFRWHDESLKYSGSNNKNVSLRDIWNPRLQIVNRQRVWNTLPEEAEINPQGDVILWQRVWGNFSQPFNLKKFPFDRQTLNIIVVAVGISPEKVQFVVDEEHPSGLAKTFSQPEWYVENWDLKPGLYQPIETMEAAPSITMSVTIKRKSSYYLYKFIIPLLLIMGMSYTIFWLSSKESSTRVGLAATSMLTLVAYRFMISADLPKVPYLTRMDIFILYATIMVFAVLVVSAYLSVLIKNNETKKVDLYDLIIRMIFPLFVLFGMGLPFIIY